MAAADDREDVALSSSELDDVLSSAGLTDVTPVPPEDNLELYGVWVKVKPQPVAARPSAPAELADLEGAEAGESAELTEDEQDLLAELESGTPGPSETPDLGGEADLALPEMPPLMHEEALTISEETPPSLDELSLEEPGAEALDREVAALDAELGAAETPALEVASGLPPLEEEEIHLEGPAAEAPEMPALELEDQLVLEEPPSMPLEPDIDLETATTEEPGAPEEPFPALDEDIILEEPPTLEETEAPEAEVSVEAPAEPTPTRGVAELEAADAFEPETPLAEGGPVEGVDLEAEIAPAPRKAAPGAVEASKTDAAALILEKIEQELHAIRREISDLKGELTVLRKERDELAGAERPEEPTAGGGFFGSEEDETIALTGDELDNILSTADITEAPQEGAPLAMEEPAPEEPGAELGGLDLGVGAEPEISQDVIPEDILEQPEADLDLAAQTGDETGEEMRIPEEELVDSSAEEGITDESSMLPAEDLGGVDLGMGEMPIVETEEPEPEEEVSLDLAADLAAEAEAAVAEHQAETVAPSEEISLEEEGAPLGGDLDLTAEIGAEPSPDLGIELDLGAEGEAPEAAPESGPDLAFEEEAPSLAAGEPEVQLEIGEESPEPETAPAPAAPSEAGSQPVPDALRDEIKSVLAYLDQLLEALPDEKIEEFAKSEYFGVYKKLFVELGLED